MAADFGDSAQNIVVVVMTDDHGLQPADDTRYRTLAETLRSDGRDVVGSAGLRRAPRRCAS